MEDTNLENPPQLEDAKKADDLTFKPTYGPLYSEDSLSVALAEANRHGWNGTKETAEAKEQRIADSYAALCCDSNIPIDYSTWRKITHVDFSSKFK